MVKYRQKVFTNDDIINDLKLKLEELSNSVDVKVIEQNCGVDHTHLLISTKPTIDLTKYINLIKGHSSRYLRKKYKTFLNDKLCGDNFWSPSYFISSSGNVSIDILKDYIENQKH